MNLRQRIASMLGHVAQPPLTTEQIVWLHGNGVPKLRAMTRPEVEWPQFCDALEEIVRDIERAHGIGPKR